MSTLNIAETKASYAWMHSASPYRIRFKSQMNVTNDKAVSTHMRSSQVFFLQIFIFSGTSFFVSKTIVWQAECLVNYLPKDGKCVG